MRPEDPAERLERVDAFAGHLVLSLCAEAEHRLRVVPADDPASEGFVVRSRFPGGAVRLARNPTYDVGAVTVVDQAYVEPPVWSDLDLVSGARSDVHRREAPGHDPGRYVTSRLDVPSDGGVSVPVTVVRHRDTPLDGTAPLLLYGYGAYEAIDGAGVGPGPAEPAGPRGGLRRTRTCAVAARAADAGGSTAGWSTSSTRSPTSSPSPTRWRSGTSTAPGSSPAVSRRGGLLQGAVFSQRPDRWRAVVAEVPFVDVVTTMFDATVPLTINEWDEWGDPRRRADFDWMLAYSPYDNPPPAGSRPDLLVTGAVHDPRVMVREPAKWVARLRETDPEWSPRCQFRVETGAGAHTGPSGRFGHLAYEAEVYAWILDRLGRS